MLRDLLLHSSCRAQHVAAANVRSKMRALTLTGSSGQYDVEIVALNRLHNIK